MKRTLKICIRFIIYIFLIIIITFLSYSFLNKAIEKNITTDGITSSSNVDYKVYLKENSFYNEDKLPSNMEYISTLIDYIDTDLVYSLTSTKNLDYKYTYYIEAVTRVYGDDAKKNIIYEKSDIIQEEKTIESNDANNVILKENVKINYDKYNTLAASFKTSYYLNKVSDVTVTFNINTTASGTNIIEKSSIVIPLTEQTTEITLNVPSGNQFAIIDEDEPYIITNKKYLVITGVLLLILLIVFMLFFIEIFKILFRKKNKFEQALKKILREYDLIIACANYEIDEKKYNVVTLPSFEELRDVHDNLGKPILFKRSRSKGIFVITDDTFLYKFTISQNDFKNEKVKKE